MSHSIENQDEFWKNKPKTENFISWLKDCITHNVLPSVIAEQMIKRVRGMKDVDECCEITPKMKELCLNHNITVGFFGHSCQILFSCNECANAWEPVNLNGFIVEDDFWECPNGCNAPGQTF